MYPSERWLGMLACFLTARFTLMQLHIFKIVAVQIWPKFFLFFFSFVQLGLILTRACKCKKNLFVSASFFFINQKFTECVACSTQTPRILDILHWDIGSKGMMLENVYSSRLVHSSPRVHFLVWIDFIVRPLVSSDMRPESCFSHRPWPVGASEACNGMQ